MELQSRSVSAVKMPKPVVVAPILVAFLECKKAEIFDKNATLSAWSFLDQSTSVLKGISAGGAAALAERGIKSLKDLIEKEDTLLIGLEGTTGKIAYQAKLKIVAALEKNGIAIERKFEPIGAHTLAIRLDPVTGITYSV